MSGAVGGPWTVTFVGSLADKWQPLLNADGSALTDAITVGETQAGSPGTDTMQSIVVEAAEGSFTLTFEGDTTQPIPYGATASTVAADLNALPTIVDQQANGDCGNVSVGGSGTSSNPYLVYFDWIWSGVDVPLLTADGSGLSGIGNTITTAYDADGEITSVGDNFSHYAYTYDGQGNVASVDNAGTPGVPGVKLTSGFDPAGNRTSLAATIGGTADFLNSYSYDTLSRLDQMIQQGQNGGNAVASKEIDYRYDAIGDVTARMAFNYIGIGPRLDIATSTISYNTLGQLTGISMTSDAGQVALDNLAYTYDTLGRVSTFTSIDGTATYGYDKTSQLTSATYVAAAGHTEPPNFSIAFDANGNRSTVNGTSTTISANNEVTNDGTFTYQFDAEGNRTVRTRISTAYASDYKTTYTWDYRNRLTDVENFDNNGVLTQHVHYVYDAWDHLIERQLDPSGGGSYTVDTHYVWDASAPPTLGPAGQPPNAPGNIVLAFNGSEQLTTRYLNGPNTNAYDQFFSALGEEDVTSTTSAGTLTFDLLDPQGTLTDIADSNGALADHLEYTAFGELFNETNPSVSHIAGYAGGLYDPATQLVYHIERWYDPQATVWISVDPTGFAAGSANLTGYVGNEPSDYIDSAGLAKQRPVNGETSATRNGKGAHKGFAAHVGGNGNVVLPTGEICDSVIEAKKTITIDELKPKGRLVKEGVLKGAKYNDAVRQVESYAKNVPNPQGKTIYVRLWGWVKEAGSKRYKYVKLKGWKYVAKAVPGAGTVVAVMSYGSDVHAKGLAGGTANTALDACPVVSTGKFFYEIIMGEDMVPDKSEGVPWYARLYSPIQAFGRTVANAVTGIHLSGPLFVDSRNK